MWFSSMEMMIWKWNAMIGLAGVGDMYYILVQTAETV